MIRWLILTLSLAILALPAHATGGALANAETGVSGVYTDQHLISDHPHHRLMGHIIIVRRDSALARALVIRHRRDGVHRLWFSEAWSGGERLAFRLEAGLGCTHGHCRDGPVGMILLDQAEFARAADRGLRARLIGPSGAIDIAVPADLFRDATRRAAALR